MRIKNQLKLKHFNNKKGKAFETYLFFLKETWPEDWRTDDLNFRDTQYAIKIKYMCKESNYQERSTGKGICGTIIRFDSMDE